MANEALTPILSPDPKPLPTEHEYDFRNRRTGSKGPDGVAVDIVFDNLGQVTQSSTYADLDDDFELDATELRARSETDFDDQRRPYRTRTYEVNQSLGTVGDRLTNNVWYNHRGYQVKSESPNDLFQKTLYDGAGRAVTSLTSIDDDETAWSEATDAVGDTVIQQSDTIYDPGSRVVTSLGFQRFEDDTTTLGLLDGTNSYPNVNVTWYDLADRVTHAATFGRDDGPTTYYVLDATGALIDSDGDGIPDAAEGTPYEPNQSADWIASKTEYDNAGRANRITDNKDFVTVTEFDLLNRTVRVIENYDDGIDPGDTDTDVTVEYDYDPSTGLLTVLRARNATGTTIVDQETQYLYESEINGSWTTNVIYPDSDDTDSTGTDQVKTTYDRLGRTITTTDQRGVEHTFTFDTAGRLESDAVTNVGTSGIVDDAILRIERSYDDMSRVRSITSYDDPHTGNIANQVKYSYNGYRLVSETQQAHDGAVVDGVTPSVIYNYDDGLPAGSTGGAANYVRLSSVEYPGSRVVHYLYPGSGIGDALNRVQTIADDPLGGGFPLATYVAEYAYLGAGTIVRVEHPDVTGGLTLDYNRTGDYEGWDRFGRVINQEWTDDLGDALDHYTYTYDHNSNRESRSNELKTDGSLNETYEYDGLDRLFDVDRGGAAFQDWTLDSLGNWSEFDDQGTVETRDHNEANEIDAISGSGALLPEFDAVGNMISAGRSDNPTVRQHYKYDAWNRLVEVRPDDGSGNPDPNAVTATFEYDGRNYRIQKTAGSVVQAFFYNEGQQLLETQEGGVSTEDYIWDLRYIDAPILRATPTDDLYYVNDANFNVTGLVNGATGLVVERYHYDPYGKVEIYDGLWTPLAVQESAFDNVYLFTGRRLDPEIALYYYRARYYDPQLGRFISEDPIGYRGGLNLYTYVRGNPVRFVDPSGLRGSIPSGRTPTEISVGSPFENLYDDIWNVDVEVINNKLRVSLKQGTTTYGAARLPSLVLGDTTLQDRDSAQIAVLWLQDLTTPCASGSQATNAVEQNATRATGANWTVSKKAKSRVKGKLPDWAYWETAIPTDATLVNIVLVWTDGLNERPEHHKDSGSEKALGDVPVIIGSWGGSISNRGKWSFYIYGRDLTPSNLDRNGNEEFPTAQQISTMVTNSKAVVKKRTGYKLIERDNTNTNQTDTGFDIVP